MRQAAFADTDFYPTLLRIAVPIALQSLVVNGLNAVDVLLIGQLGDTAVAAAGLAFQIFFLMSLFLFGVGSGSAIFSAQYWGRGDVVSLRHVLGLAVMIGGIGSGLFALVAVAVPQAVLGLYTQDPAVIAQGSNYLRLMGLSYIPTAITTMYAMVLRSTRQVRLPMAVGISALSFKTLLAYGLIFGVGGLPVLGIDGAAIATVLARVLECVVLLGLIYRRRLPAAARPAEMFVIDRDLLSRFAWTALPVVVGEILWSLGTTIYSGVYAHIGTESIAAFNIASTIESIALVPFMGLGNACAIMLGNFIGAGEVENAARYARRFLVLAVAGAMVVGVLVFAVSGWLLTLYQISNEARLFARSVLAVISAAMWIKSGNMMMIVGILRSGGDTRFALFADVTPLWLIGVPLSLLGAFVLHLPVYWVVAMVMADEATKFAISTWRVLSGRWINNVLQAA